MALLRMAFRCSSLNKFLINKNNSNLYISKIGNSYLASIKCNATKMASDPFLNKTAPISSSQSNAQNGKTESKALVLIADLKELRSSPRLALAVGLFGLLPLALPPFYFIYGQHFVSPFASAQLAYGAVVLSFLGGIRWGYVLSNTNNPESNLNNWANTAWSVNPCLVGWFSLLMPLSVGLLTAVIGHGLVLYRDVTSIGTYPSWFRALRFIFSLVAIMALWTSCICFYAFDKKKESEIINK